MQVLKDRLGDDGPDDFFYGTREFWRKRLGIDKIEERLRVIDSLLRS